ncbi:MAG: hypothetical protein RLP09_41560 [Sandaracinaceae bacterium]
MSPREGWRFVAPWVVTVGLLFGATDGASAQETGGSYGGARFDAPATPSDTGGGSSSEEGSWIQLPEGDGTGLILLVALFALGAVWFWARDLLGSVWVLLRGRDETCTSCDFIGRPRWGKCPKCRGSMERPF